MAARATTRRRNADYEGERSSYVSTKVIRVPDNVHEEAVRLAALRRQQPGHLLAEAWREYMEKNRAQFAADLERAAKHLRDGTLESLADFASRNADARAQAAAQRMASRSED